MPVFGRSGDGAVRRQTWWLRKRERRPSAAPHVEEWPDGNDCRASSATARGAPHVSVLLSHSHMAMKQGRSDPAAFLPTTVMESDMESVSARASAASAVPARSCFQ